MKQGVLTADRVKLMMAKGTLLHQATRPRQSPWRGARGGGSSSLAGRHPSAAATLWLERVVLSLGRAVAARHLLGQELWLQPRREQVARGSDKRAWRDEWQSLRGARAGLISRRLSFSSLRMVAGTRAQVSAAPSAAEPVIFSLWGHRRQLDLERLAAKRARRSGSPSGATPAVTWRGGRRSHSYAACRRCQQPSRQCVHGLRAHTGRGVCSCCAGDWRRPALQLPQQLPHRPGSSACARRLAAFPSPT